MKISKASGALGLAVVATIASTQAQADHHGWYAGGNVGWTEADIDEERIENDLRAAGFEPSGFRKEEDAIGYKLFAGFQFNKYFAIEGGVFDLDNYRFSTDTAPLGTLGGNIEVRGVNANALVFLPFTENFSAFGRAGVNYAEAETTYSTTGAVSVLDDRLKKRDANYKFGAGLQYDFTPVVRMRLEGERYRINDAVGNKGDIDLLSVGLIFKFGGSEPAPMTAATPMPAPVTPPLVVVVPAPPKTEQYCSILDLQFEINQDEIQREDKERLGVVGTFLNKYPNTTAVIEGHTDNVGTSEQNRMLSQRRADSVFAYLVETFQIAPSRLQAVGYGESRPIANNDTEEGKRANRRIGTVIACATDVEGLKVRPARMTMAMMIEFDRNDASIKTQYRDELSKLAKFLKANPSVTATVEGHTGNLQAPPGQIARISEQRAQNVVNYLVDDFGIARSRLTAQGFGQERRVSYNTSLEGQQENRRVNVIINYPK